jgi:acyl carrier protein
MKEQEIEQLLKNWVATNGRRGRDDDVDGEELLMEAGVLDSLGMMSLISYVETLLGSEIPDELMSFDNFESIQKIHSVFFEGERV